MKQVWLWLIEDIIFVTNFIDKNDFLYAEQCKVLLSGPGYWIVLFRFKWLNLKWLIRLIVFVSKSSKPLQNQRISNGKDGY